jgi:hypothetical protein
MNNISDKILSMNQTLMGIINKVENDQYGFLTSMDICKIMAETDDCAEFNVLVRRNLGRDVINISEYEDYMKTYSNDKNDYIRDISVGFWCKDIKDTSWNDWKLKVEAEIEMMV